VREQIAGRDPPSALIDHTCTHTHALLPGPGVPGNSLVFNARCEINVCLNNEEIFLQSFVVGEYILIGAKYAAVKE